MVRDGRDGRDGRRGPKGDSGAPGPRGPMSKHEWQGTQVRFTQPDGSWGNWVDVKGLQGEKGENGISAYQIALSQGFAGTEGDWLKSLVGKDGADGRHGKDALSPYEIAKKNGITLTEKQWIKSLEGQQGPKGERGPKGEKGDKGEQGEEGLSAYEVWLKEGHKGTEKDFFQWLADKVRDSVRTLRNDGAGPVRLKLGSLIDVDVDGAVNGNSLVFMDGEWVPGTGGGGIQSVQPGTGITIDNTDPFNPIINATGVGGGVEYGGSQIGFSDGFIQYISQTGIQWGDSGFTRDSNTGQTNILCSGGANFARVRVEGNDIQLIYNTSGVSQHKLQVDTLGIHADTQGEIFEFGDLLLVGNESRFVMDDASLRADLYIQDIYIRGYNNTVGFFLENGPGYHIVRLGDVSGADSSTSLVVDSASAHVYADGVFGRSFDADMSVNYTVSIGALGIGNGTKLVIDDSLGNIYTTTDTAFSVLDTALTEWFRVGTGNSVHKVFSGDVNDIHNKTKWIVDDISSGLLGYTDGGMEIYRTTGELWFSVSTGVGVFLGDVNNTVNGTAVAVDDTTQSIIFDYAGDSYKFPIGKAPNPGDVLTDVLGNGILSWQAGGGGGGSPLIGQTSGLVSAPAPGATFEAWFGQLAGGGGASDLATTFVGYGAGLNCVGADLASMIGEGAGADAFNAAGATFFGAAAGARAENAINTTAMGLQAGQDATDAAQSIFFGGNAGAFAVNAFESCFIGASAGANATDAARSIFIGFEAGESDTVNNTVSGHSILIGDGSNTGGFQNSVGIGTGVNNTASNQFLVNSPTEPFTQIGLNCPNGSFVAGDIGASGNETAIEVDDASQITRLGNPASFIETDGSAESITNTTKIFWVGQNTGAGDLAFRVDADVWMVRAGDLGSFGNDTLLTIDDANRQIIADSNTGSFIAGDYNNVGGSTQIDLSDSLNRIILQATTNTLFSSNLRITGNIRLEGITQLGYGGSTSYAADGNFSGKSTLYYSGSTGASTLLLPTGTTATIGTTITIKDGDCIAATSNITIDAGTSNVIAGTAVAQTLVMNTNGQSVTLQKVASNKWITI